MAPYLLTPDSEDRCGLRREKSSLPKHQRRQGSGMNSVVPPASPSPGGSATREKVRQTPGLHSRKWQSQERDESWHFLVRSLEIHPRKSFEPRQSCFVIR